MDAVSPEQVIDESEAIGLIDKVMGIRPLRAVCQPLSNSGKAVFRVDLTDDRSVSLRTSVRPRTFAFTQSNLEVLRLAGLPVPNVLGAGATPSGGSYIVLDWLPGRDLLYDLGPLSRPAMTRLAGEWVEIQRRVGRLPMATGFGWAPIGRSPLLREWTNVFGEAGTTKPAEDEMSLRGFQARLRRARAGLEPYFRTIRPICFLDDLTLKNILTENGALSGVIDVDYVCYGDPLLVLGATLSSIASDVGPAGDFYGEELLRLSQPTGEQFDALWFYAALWSVGALSLTDVCAQPDRANALIVAADSWLSRVEREASARSIHAA